jgi:Fe2+ transport system protein B
MEAYIIYIVTGAIILFGIIIYFLSKNNKSRVTRLANRTEHIEVNHNIAEFELNEDLKTEDKKTIEDETHKEDEEINKVSNDEDVDEEDEIRKTSYGRYESYQPEERHVGRTIFITIILVGLLFLTYNFVTSFQNIINNNIDNKDSTYNESSISNNGVNNTIMANNLNYVGSGIIESMNLLVILIFLGFVIGVFVKIGDLFK